VGLIDDALDRAEQENVHRPIPATTYGQITYLLKQAQIADRKHARTTGTKPASNAELARRVARQVGTTQRTVERYRDKKIKKAKGVLASRIEAAVRRTWQPKVRAAARKRASTTGGITVETRARFGFSAAGTSTDDPRLRLITQHLPPSYAARLFTAKDSGATHAQLQNIVAEGLQEEYFKNSGTRAQGLQVEFDGIQYVELDF
jgi:hypothetical protein